MKKKIILKKIIPCLLVTSMMFNMSTPALAAETSSAANETSTIMTVPETDSLSDISLVTTTDSSGFVIENGVLTGYTGSNTEIFIPDTVTKIADNAFESNSTITKVNMSDTVTEIGSEAFYNCKNLTEVTIGTYVSVIGNYAFGNCNNLTTITLPIVIDSIGYSVVPSNITTINIPLGAHDYKTTDDKDALSVFTDINSLQAINVADGNTIYSSVDGVLYNANQTTLIRYPASKEGSDFTILQTVETIGKNAFCNNKNLTSIVIPDTVDSIENSAFEYSKELTSIVVGKGVTHIGNYAFASCYKVTSFTLNATVKDTEEDSDILGYSIVSGLKYSTLYIGKDVTFIDDQFMCDSINTFSSIIVDSENTTFCSVDGILFSKDKTELIRYPRYKSGENYTIPSSVTTIKRIAFESNQYLTSITIPDTVSIIENSAFEYSKALTSIVVGKGVTRLGNYAFASCNNVTSFTLNSTVKDTEEDDEILGYSIVSGLKYSTLYIGKDVTYIDDQFMCDSINTFSTIVVDPDNSTFCTVDGVLFSKDKTELIRYPRYKSGENYTIPSSVTTIKRIAFESNQYLTSITIPDTVSIIENSAFEYSKSLTSIVIGKGVTRLGNYAFASCYNVTSFTLNSTVKDTEEDDEILGYSIVSGLKYSTLYIGKDVSYIDDQFMCDSIYNFSTIVVDPGNSTFYTDDGVLFSKDKTELIRYPRYKAGIDYTIPSSVTTIKRIAFESNQYLTSITIPETVSIIENSAFEYAKALTSIIIGTGVTRLGNYAFSSCNKVTSFTLNSTIKDTDEDNSILGYSIVSGTNYSSLQVGKDVSYVDSQFYSHKKLEQINIDSNNNTYSSINGVLFNKNATSIIMYPLGRTATSYSIPNGVTSISNKCFYDADNLISLIIPSSVAAIGTSVLEYAENIEYVEVPDSVNLIGNYSFTSAPKIVIKCITSSAAETYAIDKKIPYITDSNNISLSLSVIESSINGDGFKSNLDLNDCKFTIYNITKNESSNCVIRNGSLAISQIVNSGDEFKITITPKDDTIIPKDISFTLNSDKTYSCGEIELSKKGFISLSNVDNSINSFIFDKDGKYVGEIANTQKIYNSDYLSAGTYKVLFTKGDRNLLKQSNLNCYDEMGLASGTDYIIKEITIEIGRISNIDLGTIVVPEFSNARLGILNYDECSYSSTFDSLKVSGITNLRGTYSFATEKINQVSDIYLVITVPEEFTYALASFTLDGEQLTNIKNTTSDGTRTIRAKVSKTNGTFILSTTCSSYTDLLSSAKLSYTYNGVTVTEQFGSIESKASYVTINGPSATDTGNIVLNGLAPANSVVEIYDGNTRLCGINSRSSGLWSCTTKLDSNANSTHKLKAYINKDSEIEKISNIIEIDFSEKIPTIDGITLYYNGKKHTGTVMNPATVTFVPGNNNYELLLDIGNSDSIDKLEINAICSNKSNIIEAHKLPNGKFLARKKIEPKTVPPTQFLVYYTPKTDNGVVNPKHALIPYSYTTGTGENTTTVGNTSSTKTLSSSFNGFLQTQQLGDRIVVSDVKTEEERILEALEGLSDIWKNATVTKIDDDNDENSDTYRVILADGKNSEVIIKIDVSEGSNSLPSYSTGSGSTGSGSTGSGSTGSGSTGSGSTANVSSSQLANDPNYTKVQLSSDTYIYVNTSFESTRIDDGSGTGSGSSSGSESSGSGSESSGSSSGSTYSSQTDTQYHVDASSSVYVEVGGNIVSGIGMEVVGNVFGDAGGAIVGGIGLVNDSLTISDAYLKMADLEAQIKNDSSLSDAQKQAKLEALDRLRDSYNAYAFLKAGLAVLTLAGVAGVLFTGPIGIAASLAITAIVAALDVMVGKMFKDYMQYLEWFNFNWLIDPSGYVYEAVPSNRLEGVKVSVYEQGDNADEELFWDAETYNQINPQYTDANGVYGWDVTAGKWKVKAQMDGYISTESDWLDVPPVQTEVNLAMVSTKKPEVSFVNIHPEYAEITFDKYMKVNTINTSNITIEGAQISSIEPINSEKGIDGTTDLATKFKINFATNLTVGSSYTVTVSNNVVNYANLNMESNYTNTLSAESLITNVSVDSNFTTTTFETNKEITIPVTFEPANIASGKQITCVIPEWQQDFVNVKSTTTVDSSGKGTITLTLLMPGDVSFAIGLDGTSVIKDVELNIEIPEETPDESGNDSGDDPDDDSGDDNQPKSYTVSFVTNTTDCNTPSDITVTNGNTYSELPSLSRTGYSFDGWYTSNTNGTKVTTSDVVSLTTNQTLYALWTANNYTVTFNANGGKSSSTSKSVTYGLTYGTLPTATRSGYTFAGWYTAKTNGTKINSSNNVNLTNNQTLYAIWTANKYKVTFNANGGKSSSTSKSVSYNSKYGTLPTSTRSGYTFTGWYTQKTGGSLITATTAVKITKATTLYARYKYKVSFDKNGGSKVSSSSKTVYCLQKYGTLPTATRSGYLFTGWYTKKTGGSLISKNSTVSNTKISKLYARWTKSYSVSFNKNGGSSVSKSKITVGYNKKYGTLPTAKRTGYKFTGWYTKKSGGSKITSTSTVKITKNTTLYARWSKISVAKASIKSVASTSKNIKVTLNKVSGANGYEITYATNSKFTSGKKTVYVTSTSKNITSLIKNKKYYVKVRAYKTDSAGKKVYGAYSAVKTITVK